MLVYIEPKPGRSESSWMLAKQPCEYTHDCADLKIHLRLEQGLRLYDVVLFIYGLLALYARHRMKQLTNLIALCYVERKRFNFCSTSTKVTASPPALLPKCLLSNSGSRHGQQKEPQLLRGSPSSVPAWQERSLCRNRPTCKQKSCILRIQRYTSPPRSPTITKYNSTKR